MTFILYTLLVFIALCTIALLMVHEPPVLMLLGALGLIVLWRKS